MSHVRSSTSASSTTKILTGLEIPREFDVINRELTDIHNAMNIVSLRYKLVNLRLEIKPLYKHYQEKHKKPKLAALLASTADILATPELTNTEKYEKINQEFDAKKRFLTSKLINLHKKLNTVLSAIIDEENRQATVEIAEKNTEMAKSASNSETSFVETIPINMMSGEGEERVKTSAPR